MKAYLFNVDNGLFEGEAFEDPEMLQYEEGITPVPPPEYEHGQVPVYDRLNNNWNVMPINTAKQLLNIRTSDSTGNRS
jgi:hypothetical protein